VKLATNENLRLLVAAIRETASRMEGLSMLMKDFACEPLIFQHGREVENAALIAESWCQAIEVEYNIKPANELVPTMVETTHAMGCHMGGIGDKVMNFIIDSRLLSTDCPACPDEGTLTVWSANAAEQIEAFIAGIVSQGSACGQNQNDGDIETIRRAKELYKRLRGYYPDSLDVFEETLTTAGDTYEHGKCSTCRFHSKPLEDGSRTCLAISQDSYVVADEKRLAFTHGDHDEESCLVTKPSFGCVMWEPKNE